MAKIIAAFSETAQLERIAGALEGSGIPVFRRCLSGADAMRGMTQCADSVLVCAPLLRDRTADELAADCGAQALVLVAGRPERLALCESPRLFRLAWPFSRAELVSAVRMLLQLHDMRLPRRGGEEKQLVELAKCRLMEERGLTEPESHRLLQRASMDLGIRMVEGARRILNGDGLR